MTFVCHYTCINIAKNQSLRNFNNSKCVKFANTNYLFKHLRDATKMNGNALKTADVWRDIFVHGVGCHLIKQQSMATSILMRHKEDRKQKFLFIPKTTQCKTDVSNTDLNCEID